MRRIVPLFIGSLAACSEGPLSAPPVPQTITEVVGLYTLSTVNDDSVAGNRIFVGLRPCISLPSADDSLFVGPEGSIDLRNDRTLEWNLVRQTFCSATSDGGVDSLLIGGTYTTTDLRAIVVTVRFTLSDTFLASKNTVAPPYSSNDHIPKPTLSSASTSYLPVGAKRPTPAMKSARSVCHPRLIGCT